MRLTLNSLSGHLDKGLAPLYLLFGVEALLCEEALDKIRIQSKQDGFIERLRFTHEPGFDWGGILSHCQSVSLFSEKRLIELRIPSGKPGDVGANILVDLAASPPENAVLIVVSNAIDKRTQNTKWFKAIESDGVVIECPVIPTGSLSGWIARRMRAKGLIFQPAAVEKLKQYVEGNLLAATQEINLLALLYPDTELTAELVEKVIADHARFNVYGFVDSCVAGMTQRSLRILASLEREQVEPVIVLWALTREVRTLCKLAVVMENGENPQVLFRRFGVWSSRSSMVSQALQRTKKARWETLLRKLTQADAMVKGSAPMGRKDIWQEIESISLGVCGVNIP